MQSTVTIDRNKYLGGSDIPAVMGISPFTSRFDLLQYKLGVKKNEFNGNIYTDYGNTMESKIRAYINMEYDYNFKEDKVILTDSEILPCRYHADGVDAEKKTMLEVKTTSQIKEDIMDYKHYLVQILYGMWAYGYDEGVLAVYSRPKDLDEKFDPTRLQVFFFGREDYENLLNEIWKSVRDFREDYKYLAENPWADEAQLPSRAMLMSVSTEIMGLENSIAQAQAIVKQYDALKKDLCNLMQEHGVKSWIMPNGTKVTLIPQGQDTLYKEFDTKKFQEDYKELYEQYTNDKIRKGKSAYIRITPLVKGE